jgi:hypothetical protein
MTLLITQPRFEVRKKRLSKGRKDQLKTASPPMDLKASKTTHLAELLRNTGTVGNFPPKTYATRKHLAK